MPLTRINGTQIAENSITAEDIVYSLDDAYDNGGSGTGRTITADAGAVIIDAGGNIALEITGTLRSTSSVTATSFSGSLTKLSGGGDYLIAGGSIALTTGSNGEVTIASTTTPSYVTSLTWLVG